MLLGDRLHQAMAQVERLGPQLALVYLDLDGFKAINDTYGHEAGDQLLVTVAQRMKQTLREGDTIARLGGDEFVAVLLNCNQGSSAASFQRLLEAASQPVQLNGSVMHVSASLGVTFYPQANCVDTEQLLNQADQAMYQTKLSGKNRYYIFKQDGIDIAAPLLQISVPQSWAND
jgi:diguanylate cyclase (GGDEF)-like protein